MSSETSTEPSGAFRPFHFFLLSGVLAATAAVLVTSERSPAALIVLSTTVIAAGIAAAILYQVVLPLVAPDRLVARARQQATGRARLEREKMLVLRSIKELEFDRAMGKVDDRDFEEMDARLRLRAAGLLRQLDAGQDVRAWIAAELGRRLDAARLEAAASPECPSCGTANESDARFCKQCGARLDA